MLRSLGGPLLAALLAGGAVPALARDLPGVTATEIRIGNTDAYSGPASAYGVIGKTEAAFFRMVNDQGGVAGHKINFISYDDAYSPPKTVEQVRRLIEEDQVAFLFQNLGTPTNTAIQRCVNMKKVPHLFISNRGGQMGRLQALSVDDGLPAQLSDRGADLYEVHAVDAAEREDGDPLPER
ncbi:ABC transporter substrate-binding protein [Rhodopila globiformis]|uniref:ABC transporter substrate-binding protein n=1 Tax=Rhodopila globiformis TaxID=1071 RepID=UPI00195D4383|nr:ABC transporter substrate-binding protein [Rhodopila globiformis]